MRVAGRIVETEGAKLHTQELGNPEGPPILFLHGGAGTLEDFAPLMGSFARFRCIMMDSRGHGASTLGDAPLTYAQLAADAEAVITAFGLRRPVIVGHSDGGIAGIQLAIRKKHPLAGLVTVGAHADPPRADVMERLGRLTLPSWRERFPEGVALYERLNPEANFDRLFAALLAMWLNTAPGNYPGEATRRVECPVLVLGGDADHLVPREQTVHLATTLPDARLGIFPFGSHVCHQEHPERVVPYIMEFLESL